MPRTMGRGVTKRGDRATAAPVADLAVFETSHSSIAIYNCDLRVNIATLVASKQRSRGVCFTDPQPSVAGRSGILRNMREVGMRLIRSLPLICAVLTFTAASA